MNYPIPDSPQKIFALRQQPIDEELVASAIVGVIKLVRSQGESLDELTAQLLADDPMLNHQQRRWLSQLVTQSWEQFS
ncbi:hypothetical protein [Umezakia ovalisporum]|uniref:Uncharacterized protein n=2 Tax=Umezakia ovalisporum TaxID=75695 RepID=A0AA43KE24_9CYAN|nr:hypothetical protein [Umezakia ovalisporum]MDH6057231.1 hypothetical protein [Umezakia ovalisporum FSS-43]MDH6062578.1 hypothetical protein [Umezakia ovalisporum FSS-62]MDH6068813.1 hypothetical protein [Umezakia ovalisporum APH033B]MDH6070302.1 hypothetical protein [Umezakia ovalisporum CobakiLakeA]MDH6076056.1 hypothetical protein [Umezakia ovalisporum CS-1034]